MASNSIVFSGSGSNLPLPVGAIAEDTCLAICCRMAYALVLGCTVKLTGIVQFAGPVLPPAKRRLTVTDKEIFNDGAIKSIFRKAIALLLDRLLYQ